MRGPESVALALAACLLASCYRDAPADEPSNHADGSPGDEILSYLPVDSELVFGFDVARMRSSPLWARFEPRIANEAKSDLAMFRKSCGFDPTQTVQRIAFGLKWKHDDVTGVVVVRGVDTARMLGCVADQFGKHGDAITDRGVVIMDAKEKRASAWTAVGSDTVVVQIAPGVNHDSIAAIVAGGAPLRASPIFMAMYDHLEHGASAWGVVNGASGAADFFEDVRPRTIDGTIVTTDRVTLAGRFKMATPELANKLAGMMNKDLSRAPFLTRRDAVVTGSTIKVDVVLTADQLEMALHEIGIH